MYILNVFLSLSLSDSCAALTKTKTYRVELMYGQEFTIKLPVGSEKLTFISADSSQENVLWGKYVRAKRGSVTGRDDAKKFTIRSVTFEDEGTYSVLNFWDKKTAIYLLKIIRK